MKHPLASPLKPIAILFLLVGFLLTSCGQTVLTKVMIEDGEGIAVFRDKPTRAIKVISPNDLEEICVIWTGLPVTFLDAENDPFGSDLDTRAWVCRTDLKAYEVWLIEYQCWESCTIEATYRYGSSKEHTRQVTSSKER